MSINFDDFDDDHAAPEQAPPKRCRWAIVSSINGAALETHTGGLFTNVLVRSLLDNEEAELDLLDLVARLKKDMRQQNIRGPQGRQMLGFGVLPNTGHEGGNLSLALRKAFLPEEEEEEEEADAVASADPLKEMLEKSLNKLRQEFSQSLEANQDALVQRLLSEKEQEEEPEEAPPEIDTSELMNLIRKGKISKLFDRLEELEHRIPEDELIEFINIQSQWTAIENQVLMGVVDYREENITKNKLRKSLIMIMRKL